MKLLSAKEIEIKKRNDEIALEKRIEILKKEESLLIKSVNDKRAELDKLGGGVK